MKGIKRMYGLVLALCGMVIVILGLYDFARSNTTPGLPSELQAASCHSAAVAYTDGIQLGQQMIMERLMPTAEAKAKARQRCIELVRAAGSLTEGLHSLDEYRDEASR